MTGRWVKNALFLLNMKMIQKASKNFFQFTTLGLVFVVALLQFVNVKAQAGSAYDLINEVNALRTANGLPAFSINAQLMAAAQGHADWISATGQGGHIGVDGTYAVDRARIAGYVGLVNENWARGYGLSVYDCIYISWNDPDHMGNMLASWHNEVGAGVSIDSENRVTYILNVGHTTGNNPITLPTSAPGATSEPYVQPIMTSTPGANGQITHKVVYGETLWTISEAYGISLDELLSLNGLTMESAIYPDEILIIKVGSTPEPTPTTAITPTPTLKPTQTPRPTLTPLITQIDTPQAEVTPGVMQRIFSGDRMGVGIALIGICILGLALLIISTRRVQ